MVLAEDAPDADDNYEIDKDQDDTADIDTESSIDTAYDRQGVRLTGDFRPLFDYLDEDGRDGSTFSDTSGLARLRVKGIFSIARSMQVGVRLAGRCTTNECSPEWVWDGATPGPNGLQGGQITFDEAYLHIFKRERFDVAVGRQQTRFVLRGGVFARSLDRNDSNNTNVTWTDGLYACQ